MTDKTQHILETIALLIDELDNEEIKMSLVRIADSVAHTAPEIIDNRWSTLFKFCTHYIRLLKVSFIQMLFFNNAVFKPVHTATNHMRNTPYRVCSTGALKAAERAKPSTILVSAGSMIPSSQSRDVA